MSQEVKPNINIEAENLKAAASRELDNYNKALLQLLNKPSVKKKHIIRALSLGMTQGLVGNNKSPMDFTEETIAKILHSMSDCVFALKALRLDEEYKNEQSLNKEGESNG